MRAACALLGAKKPWRAREQELGVGPANVGGPLADQVVTVDGAQLALQRREGFGLKVFGDKLRQQEPLPAAARIAVDLQLPVGGAIEPDPGDSHRLIRVVEGIEAPCAEKVLFRRGRSAGKQQVVIVDAHLRKRIPAEEQGGPPTLSVWKLPGVAAKQHEVVADRFQEVVEQVLEHRVGISKKDIAARWQVVGLAIEGDFLDRVFRRNPAAEVLGFATEPSP